MAQVDSLEALEQFIESDEFCNGKVSVVAYNTAWVARIRDSVDPDKPAFPKSLEWVRDHQLKDGSWGSSYPVLIFERIVSSLISVICLKQWGMETDLPKIEKGVAYIKNNLKHLERLEELQDKMTIGFELILPTLIEEAESMGIEFDQEQAIKVYRNEKEKKMSRILQCEKAGINFSGIKSWCFTLEALGALYSEDEIIKMVAENDLICCSYGATAYALFKDNKMDRSLNHIRKVVAENNGGVPSLYKVEVFDLAWSLNSLIFVDFKMDQENLIGPLNKLKTLWDNSKGMLGACIGLPPDADDTANTIFALSSTGLLFGVESLKSLLKFFRNNYFITFEAEKHPSLSTNINCLIALKNFQQYPVIRDITYKVYEWTKSNVIASSYHLQDKWHFSSFYPLTRALLAFEYIDENISETIYKMLLNLQNEDGGWGSDGKSSFLESSYVVISVVYWLRNHYSPKEERGFAALERARRFMANYKDEQTPFWIDKALYSPINVDKTSILAARFALDQVLK